MTLHPILKGVLITAVPAAFVVAGGVTMFLILNAFDPMNHATVVKVCHDGTEIFRMPNGEYRTRNYHAAGPEICQP
jgi:hypothetical protein